MLSCQEKLVLSYEFYTEAYSEPYQTSYLVYVEKVFVKHSILVVWLGSVNTSDFCKHLCNFQTNWNLVRIASIFEFSEIKTSPCFFETWEKIKK